MLINGSKIWIGFWSISGKPTLRWALVITRFIFRATTSSGRFPGLGGFQPDREGVLADPERPTWNTGAARSAQDHKIHHRSGRSPW